MDKQALLKKIEDKKIIAGVVGLGYVGLPLAVERPRQDLKQSDLTYSRKKWNW